MFTTRQNKMIYLDHPIKKRLEMHLFKYLYDFKIHLRIHRQSAGIYAATQKAFTSFGPLKPLFISMH